MEIKDFSDVFLDDIVEIEKNSFRDPWTKKMFMDSAANDKTKFKICFENEKAVGFCLYWTAGGETELLNIAVDPRFRRRSAAKKMLEYMEKDAKRESSEAVFLEARESNFAAISLYISFGFDKIGIRKKYYADEDAILLRKII